ncbi:MAG: DCC1-like thiol-disulfide oxidoreductase family protein, partial [Pseudomonadota bacterium]
MRAGDPDTTYVIYDGDCPFCTAFVKMTRLKEAAGKVELLNLRDPHPVVAEVAEMGLDFDEGMAMVRAGQVYHGDDVVHQLALMTSRVGVFNRLNAWIFKHPRLTRALY